MILVLIIFVVVLILAYFYIKLKYFTLRGPLPGLPPQILFGNMRQTGMTTRNESGLNVHRKLQQQFGDIYQFWMGALRVIVVSDVDDIQHICTHRHIYDQGDLCVVNFNLLFHDALICLRGPKYKRHASVTLPLFRRSRIIHNLDEIIECTDKILLDQWRSSDPKKVHLDIAKQSDELLLTIFGYVAFDYHLETSKDNELTCALQDFLTIFKTTLYMPRFMSKIYLKFNSKYRQVMTTIEKYFYRMIDQEQSKNKEEIAQRKRTSLIASLVSSLQTDETAEALKAEHEKKGLSRHEVLHEMLLFFMAGFDTTSTLLAWFVHLMSKHPRVQAKIKAELAGYTKQYLSIEQLDSLVYLDAVIREILRFVPPSNGSVRTLNADDRLPKSQAQLYKNDQVFIPFYNLARDNRYWKVNPDLFYPERFLNDSEDKNHHPYAWIPFGVGHRQCIGQELARFEIKAITARLMQYVTFVDGGPEVNSGEHDSQFTNKPKHVGVTISFD